MLCNVTCTTEENQLKFCYWLHCIGLPLTKQATWVWDPLVFGAFSKEVIGFFPLHACSLCSLWHGLLYAYYVVLNRLHLSGTNSRRENKRITSGESIKYYQWAFHVHRMSGDALNSHSTEFSESLCQECSLFEQVIKTAWTVAHIDVLFFHCDLFSAICLELRVVNSLNDLLQNCRSLQLKKLKDSTLCLG